MTSSDTEFGRDRASGGHQYSDDDAEFGPASTSDAAVVSALPARGGFRAKMGLGVFARRTLGIILLLVTVSLWTLSNFLASSIFSNQTYDKPFFLLYVNSAAFTISVIPMFLKYLFQRGVGGLRADVKHLWHEWKYAETDYKVTRSMDEEDAAAGESLLAQANGTPPGPTRKPDGKLDFRQTFRLSMEFCMIWFVANYLSSASLQYTSVASVMILSSTSSVWTLVLCALFRVETFSLRKLAGVLASLAGVVLVSTLDVAGGGDSDRGSFPHKTPGQVASGDAMAFLGAVMYGVYVTMMKKRVGTEDRMDMMLFFGLVGVINLATLWPLFFILDWTGMEPFALPPSGAIWAIIIFNALASYISDLAWASAMLLTTPLVVTVGLSLTIPLSLIGEMIQYGQYSSLIYWLGAAVVFASFIFINRESHDEDDQPHGSAEEPAPVVAASG